MNTHHLLVRFTVRFYHGIGLDIAAEDMKALLKAYLLHPGAHKGRTGAVEDPFWIAPRSLTFVARYALQVGDDAPVYKVMDDATCFIDVDRGSLPVSTGISSSEIVWWGKGRPGFPLLPFL